MTLKNKIQSFVTVRKVSVKKNIVNVLLLEKNVANTAIVEIVRIIDLFILKKYKIKLCRTMHHPSFYSHFSIIFTFFEDFKTLFNFHRRTNNISSVP